MEHDGPEEWHVASGNGEARDANPDLDEDFADDDPDDELWAAPLDAGIGVSGRGGGARGNPARRLVFGGNSTWATVVVAIAAAAVGVAVGLAFLRSPGPAVSAASPGSSSAGSGAAPAPVGSAPVTLGPPQGNGGAPQQQLQIIGTVTAVSRSSITIGGNGPSITGTFTSATKFTGSVANPSGIKTGDHVAALLTGTPPELTVATLQDPVAQ